MQNAVVFTDRGHWGFKVTPLPRPHHDAMIIMMRTTINLPDDVYEAARSVAAVRGVSLGEALAELARRGLRPAVQINTKKSFPCFNVPANAKPITLEQTLEAEDDL